MLSLLVLLPTAHAAGYHFVRADALAGATNGAFEAGVGASLLSDALAGWITFGDPASDRQLVRAWRIESAWNGPVLGVVPRDFRGLVPQYEVPFAVPWVTAHVGGDAAAGTRMHGGLSGHYLLNVPGFFELDPRRAYVGPSAGVGVEGVWWLPDRVPDAGPATGAATAQAGLLAGVTVRDTWYAQARAVGRVNLFGAHDTSLELVGVTGFFLDRVGAPFGVELRGEYEPASGGASARWAARASLYWKLTPPYQTRIEEELEHRRREEAVREFAPAG
jgi:hypothetical protein